MGIPVRFMPDTRQLTSDISRALQRSPARLRGAAKRHLAYAVRAMQQYPPARSNSTYIRTGKYGQAWDIRDSVVGFGAEAVNTRDYAVWVGGARTQTAVHRGTGWRRSDEAIEGIAVGLLRDLSDAVQGSWEF